MSLYRPQHFAVDERASLRQVMRDHPFALLVSAGAGEPQFTHLPLVAREAGDRVVLLGHAARANPHAARWRDGAAITAIFSGPSAYVAPSWYSTKEAVPTWNYIVVHAHGTLRVVDDRAGKEHILKALIDAHDPAYRAQWDTELAEDFRERMLRAIVGCEIAVERLEGKFKLSQNRPAPDQSAVRAAHARGDAQARMLAEWMQRLGIGAAG